MTQTMTKTINFLFIYPEGEGHSNCMRHLAQHIEKTEYGFKVRIFHESIRYDYSYSQDPTKFTIHELVDRVKKMHEKYEKQSINIIVYDFFAVDGYILSRMLNCKYICSIPAFIGENFAVPVEPASNSELFDVIHKNFGIIVENKNIHKISDAFYYPFDNEGYLNAIIWNYPIIPNDYFKGYQYVGCSRNLIEAKTKFIKEKMDVIYISMGTIVPRSMFLNTENCRDFIVKVYNTCIETCIKYLETTSGREKFLYVSCPDMIKNSLTIKNTTDKDTTGRNTNVNVIISDHFDQYEILKISSLFVTHGGGNSFQEALTHGVPQFCIPFFGDQFVVANTIEQLKLGKNIYANSEMFNSSKINKISDLTSEDNIIEREKYVDIIPETFREFIKSIEGNEKKTICIEKNEKKTICDECESRVSCTDYIQNDIVKSLVEKQLTRNFSSIFADGDLIYGTTVDRTYFTKNYIDGPDRFKIGEKNESDEYMLFDELDLQYDNPVIIDQYNDLIRKYSTTELQKMNLSFDIVEYKNKICEKMGFEYESKITAEGKTLLEMCCIGLEYFLGKKRNIYFVVKSYDSKKNIGTHKEMMHMIELLNARSEYMNNVFILRFDENVDGFIFFNKDDMSILIDLDQIEWQHEQTDNVLNSSYGEFTRFIDDMVVQYDKKGKEKIWIQTRLKQIDSIKDKLINKICLTGINDIIGFRMIFFNTEQMNKFSHFFKSCIRNSKYNLLNIIYNENNRVVYFRGMTDTHISFEVQMWTSSIYYGFINEYDIYYKTNFEKINQTLHEKIYIEEHRLQEIIDSHEISRIINSQII